MSTITYIVKVASSKFEIDDASAPKLTFRDGDTYVFDQADSSNSGHILQFSITSNNSGGAEYTTGVTKAGTPGSAGAKTTIVTSGSTTDTLYYYSSGGGTHGEEFSNTGFNTSTTYNLLKPIVGAESTAEKWGPMVNHSIDQISEKFAAIDAIPTYDDNVIHTNIALLAFKTAVNGSLAKYSLQDQVIDEYTDATGIDATLSTNHVLAGGAYSGINATLPTVTHNAGATGIDGDDTWYRYTATGSVTYTNNTTQDHDFLVIAGGGGGGGCGNAHSGSGGGGAGGYRNSYASEATGGGGSNETALSLLGGTAYTITVGTGGAGGLGSEGYHTGVAGVGSSISGADITDITTTGGGFGASGDIDGGAGGSGGGGGWDGSGGAGTTNQGYDGGTGGATAEPYAAAGGGGAGGAGNAPPSDSVGGAGGIGLSSSIDGSATDRGGGGGASGSYLGNGTAGTASHGGGAGTDPGTGVAGTANTGGGGGGGGPAASGTVGIGGVGGSGIVIIRRPTLAGTINNMTLQSTDTTAEAAPTKADMVMLMEDTAGTATLNTDIKGYVSRDSGATFTEGVLVDEGDWGTNKRILAFHDLSFTSSSGTAMCYKITTHNQVWAKQTKIHATSIGWR